MSDFKEFFEVKCKKCGSLNCSISGETDYGYDWDESLTPMGEYYEIKCEDCGNDYSSL